jgi:hypothetical protein
LWHAAGVSNAKRQIRSLVLSVDLVGSRRIWPALKLDGPSIQTAPDGSRRIVWMINRMIKHLDRSTLDGETSRRIRTVDRRL